MPHAVIDYVENQADRVVQSICKKQSTIPGLVFYPEGELVALKYTQMLLCVQSKCKNQELVLNNALQAHPEALVPKAI